MRIFTVQHTADHPDAVYFAEDGGVRAELMNQGVSMTEMMTNTEAARFRTDEEMEVEHRGYIDDKYLVIKAADLDALGKGLGVSDEHVNKVRGWIDDLMLDSFIFVLRPDRDYHARVALAAYAESVRVFDATLADDLQQALSVMDVPEVKRPD